MSRLIMWNLPTLDGYFQGANNRELDWHRDAWGEEEDAAAQVPELKRHGTGDMLVFGSANRCATLMQHDLFDEYRLAVTPTVLGSGATLFGRSLNRRRLDLLEVRPLASGCIILRYRPDRGH